VAAARAAVFFRALTVRVPRAAVLFRARTFVLAFEALRTVFFFRALVFRAAVLRDDAVLRAAVRFRVAERFAAGFFLAAFFATLTSARHYPRFPTFALRASVGTPHPASALRASRTEHIDESMIREC
jgi:hypothetical protein